MDATSNHNEHSATASSSRGHRGYLLAGGLALAWLAYFFTMLAIPGGVEAYPTWLQFTVVVAGIALLLVLLLYAERPAWPRWARWALFSAGVTAFITVWLFNLGTAPFRAFVALGIAALALPVGYWIGGHLEKLSHLIPVALAFTFADIFSVYQGLTGRVVKDIEQHQESVREAVEQAVEGLPPEEAAAVAEQAARSVPTPFVDFLVAHFPLLGSGTSVPVLGIGDFVILALLFRLVWRYQLSPWRVLLAGVLSVVVALMCGMLLAAPVPALPFIALGVVGYLAIADRRVRALGKQEIVLSIAVPLVFIALLAARILSARGG